MTIRKCKRSDWGEYKVTAKNSSGSKFATSSVNVHDVPGKVVVGMTLVVDTHVSRPVMGADLSSLQIGLRLIMQ